MANITYDESSHLLRRMGFGGSIDDINALMGRTRERAVDRLLNFESTDNQEMEDRLRKTFNPKKFTPHEELQFWWIVRMILTTRPFEEKMTLFWHNHFATALDKVDYDLMYVQNLMLRSLALDRFDTLLLNVARDPAMLVWLDGVTNVLGAANENWARESQELFSMGVTDVVTGAPNYTEGDVKGIARAFTGWKFTQKGDKRYKFRFQIVDREHDNGAKEIYGRTANFTGEDVIDLICARRSTGRFLVKRLFEFFVYPLGKSAEDLATIEKFADVYFNSNHSIKDVMRAIFISDEFFSSRARFALVKSPAELVVGSFRMLGVDYNPGDIENGDYGTYDQFKRLGLDLMNPFDVSGWKLNLGWINTSTLLERYNFATRLISERSDDKRAPGPRLSNDQLRKYADPSPDKTVQNFLSLLGPLKTDADTTKILSDYLQTDDDGRRVPWVVNDNNINKLVRGLVFLIMCLPEFQMN